MIGVAQGVDYGYGGPRREVVDGLLGKHAGHDAMHPAVEIARDIFEGLAHADRAIDEYRGAAELLDRQFERQPGTKRWLFEKQGNRLPRQNSRELRRIALNLVGQ